METRERVSNIFATCVALGIISVRVRH